MADRFVILNRCLCILIPQDLVLIYVGPLGHLWQILVKVIFDPNSCTRLLFPNGTCSSCFGFVLCKPAFYYRSQGKLMCLLKWGSESFSVVLATLFCGALMLRAIIIFSQTNTQSRQIFLSQSGTDITKFHVLILLCHVLPNPMLCHFFSTFSSNV